MALGRAVRAAINNALNPGTKPTPGTGTPATLTGAFTVGQSNLDAVTYASYTTATTGAAAATVLLNALPNPVTVEICDGSNVVRAFGTLTAPWATIQNTVLNANTTTSFGIDVTSGGTPDNNWYCQFRSGSRFIRGTFGLLHSGRNFVLSLTTFKTGDKATLGAVAFTAVGTVATNSPPVWSTVPSLTLTQGTSLSLPELGYVSDPDNDPMLYEVVSGTLPSGVSLNTTTGVLTAAANATVVANAGPFVVSANDQVVTVQLTNTAAPAVSGFTVIGSALSVTTGTWSGTAPITYAYQWLRNGFDINGALSSTYTLVGADLGAFISARVTATNPAGSVPVTSLTVGPVTQAQSGTLSVPFTLTSAVGGSNLPWTFGHAFKQGDVQSGQTIAASVGEFQAVPMSYWPDGSLKHAIISGRTTLPAGVATTFALGIGAATGGSNLTEAELSSWLPATTITAGGHTMTLNSIIGTAARHRTVCAGPVMSNWIYRQAVSGSNHLVLWADVRLYKGGAVEIFPWVENAYLNVANPTNDVRTYTVTMGGVARFSQSIDVKHRTRVPLFNGSAFSYWSGADPGITPRHDRAYLISTKLVPNYGYNSPPAATLNALTQTYTPNTLAGTSSPMDNAGGSGSIIPSAQALYITSNGDVRAYRAAIVRGLSSGSWSIHYRDENTNDIIKFSNHASTDTSNIPAGTGGTNGTFGTNITTHQPSFGYLPFLISGRLWYWEESAFWATMNYLQCGAQRRRGEATFGGPYYFTSGSAGILDPKNGAFANRGAHWAINRLSQTLALCPSGHSTYVDWVDSWEKNTEFYKAVYVDGTFAAGWVSPQGILGGYARYSYASNSATSVYGEGFESNYGPLVWGFAADIGLPQSAASLARHFAVRDHAYKQVTTRSADGTSSYNWRRFGVFSYPIGAALDGSSTKPASWYTGAESLSVLEAGFSLGSIAATLGLSLKDHSSNTDMALGSSTANDYIPAPMAALAYAVDHGAPGATAGWARISGASNFTSALTNLHANPQFGIVPRN